MEISKQRGVVLIVVLWIVALLTVLLAAFTATVKVDRHVATDVVEGIQARTSADSVLGYLSALREADPELWPNMLGQVYELQLNNLLVRFRMVPETAYVGLNSASIELLSEVFAAAQVPDAQQLAQLIVERRSATADPQAGEQVTPGLFSSVFNLTQLPQISAEAQQSMQHWFTVDSLHEGVNLAFAPADLVHALLPNEAATLLAERAENAVLAAETINSDFMQLDQGNTVRVQVELSGSASKRKIEATVAFNDGDLGYHVVRWNEYNAHFSLD